MASENQSLIKDFRALQQEAAKTLSALNQFKGNAGAVAGGGGGLSSAGSSTLSSAGAMSTTNSITTSPPIKRGGLSAGRNALNNFNTRDASQIIRSSTELAVDASSGDPVSIGLAARGLLKDLRVGGEAFNKTIGTIGVAIGAGAQGFNAAKNYNKTGNQSILEVFGSGASAAGMGFSVGGPWGAAAATALWTAGALYSSFAPSEKLSRKMTWDKAYESVEKSMRDFSSIYGVKTPTSEDILSEVAKGDESTLTEDLTKAAKDIDEGYKQVGLGNFDKGADSIKKGLLEANKYGLLSETQIINTSHIYNMLESQRFAVRYFAQTQGSLSASRTGD